MMEKQITCPFCKSKNIFMKRDIISPLNQKKYYHYYCKECELEFFYPLQFELEVYESELLEDYKLFHKGTRDIPEWTKIVIKTIKKLNINLKNKKILDIGAGDGNNYIALKREFGIKSSQYYAIECDRKSINVLKQRGVTNVINNFFDKNILKIINIKFDIILATEVLEHQVNPKEFIDTIFKLLNKNGLAIITVPNRDRFLIKYKEFPADLPPHHFLRFNKKFFIKNFKDKIIFIKDYPLNAPIKIQSQLISLKIVRNTKLWPIFLPFTIVLRLMNAIKGGGIIVVLINRTK